MEKGIQLIVLRCLSQVVLGERKEVKDEGIC